MQGPDLEISHEAWLEAIFHLYYSPPVVFKQRILSRKLTSKVVGVAVNHNGQNWLLTDRQTHRLTDTAIALPRLCMRVHKVMTKFSRMILFGVVISSLQVNFFTA